METKQKLGEFKEIGKHRKMSAQHDLSLKLARSHAGGGGGGARAPTGSAASHHVLKMEVNAFEIRVDNGEGWSWKAVGVRIQDVLELLAS